MRAGGDNGVSPEVEAVRDEYEASLSWRVTSPLRAIKRRGRALRDGSGAPIGTGETPGYDSWLRHLAGDRLETIEAACASGDPECYRLFRDLDDDLWTLLLTREYDCYPNIRALLPDVPDPALQLLWNGASGLRLGGQSQAFYRKVRNHFESLTGDRLDAAKVLDFGCGWGRLTRLFARDVEPGNLFGCDPVDKILEDCRASRLPAVLARSEFVPERLPFEETFDLAFSFSVFTHISEKAHLSCLRALHAGLRPGGVLVVTIRPPDYLHLDPQMHPTLAALGADVDGALEEPRYLFVPHPAEPSHFQWQGGEMTYGETVITLPYVRERWAELFELQSVDILLGDMHQVMVTLRRR